MAVAIDPILYLAFALGVLARRFFRVSARRLDAATIACIVVLIGLLGASLSATPLAALALAIPVGFGLAVTMIALTALIAGAIRRPGRSAPTDGGTNDRRRWFGMFFLLVFLMGFGLGRLTPEAVSLPLRLSLYALVALVGFGLEWSTRFLRDLWVPVTASFAGAALAGLLFAFLLHGNPFVYLAIALSFGFYTLSGTLVSAAFGAYLGFVAFLTNFLRENLTMVTSPWLGPKVGAEGLTALGGATAMDTTLYFITRFGDPEAGSLALASGLILTVATTVLLPVLLALAGG